MKPRVGSRVRTWEFSCIAGARGGGCIEEESFKTCSNEVDSGLQT